MFPTDFDLYKPYFVTGLALGGVYALSGVGIVVLYRATGVLNLAFGAIGAMGALISWTLVSPSEGSSPSRTASSSVRRWPDATLW